MTPKELSDYVERLIGTTDKAYSKQIVSLQDRLYADLSRIFKSLEIDSEGNVKQSASNRRLLIDADKKIQAAFKSNSYLAAVSTYVSSIRRVDAKSAQYFSLISETFKPNRQFLKDLQFDTIRTVEKYILQDGLQSQVVNPLSQIMTQNVNGGGSYSGFMDQLKNFIKGDPDTEGRALRYTRTYLSDTLFTYARTYQKAVSSDLGLAYYLYSGGIQDTTREFCEQRAGKYFHENEIKSWASLEWSGKKPDTTESSIFVYCGGWGCKHELIPVSERIVPKDVIDRNK